MRGSSERPGEGGGDPLPRALIAAALLVLAGWTLWDRWSFARSTPYPTGVDGYWYAVQLRSILEDGALHYDASPLALWLMAPLAALLGPIDGAKLGAALAAAALPLVAYPLGRRVSGERAGGLLAAVLVAASAGSFYVGTEFVKNAIALPIGIGALAALGRALERPGWRSIAGCGALLLATLLSHRLVLCFVLVAAAPPVCLAILRSERGGPRDREGEREGGRAGAWRAAAAGAALLGAALLLALRDGHLFAGLLSGRADWSLPALRLGERALTFRGEVALAGAAGLALLALAAASGRLAALRPEVPLPDRSLAWGPALWAVAIALPWLAVDDPQGLPFRLRLVAFVPLAIAAPALAAALLARVSRTGRMTILMLLCGLALYRPGRYEAPVVRVHPDMAAAVAAAAGRVPAGDRIVSPERHLVFMTTWSTRVEAQLRPDGVPRERRWRLVPMAYMSDGLQRAIGAARVSGAIPAPVSLHRGHPDGLVLMPEVTWEWVLDQLEGPERAHYAAWPTY